MIVHFLLTTYIAFSYFLPTEQAFNDTLLTPKILLSNNGSTQLNNSADIVLTTPLSSIIEYSLKFSRNEERVLLLAFKVWKLDFDEHICPSVNICMSHMYTLQPTCVTGGCMSEETQEIRLFARVELIRITITGLIPGNSLFNNSLQLSILQAPLVVNGSCEDGGRLDLDLFCVPADFGRLFPALYHRKDSEALQRFFVGTSVFTGHISWIAASAIIGLLLLFLGCAASLSRRRRRGPRKIPLFLEPPCLNDITRDHRLDPQHEGNECEADFIYQTYPETPRSHLNADDLAS